MLLLSLQYTLHYAAKPALFTFNQTVHNFMMQMCDHKKWITTTVKEMLRHCLACLTQSSHTSSSTPLHSEHGGKRKDTQTACCRVYHSTPAPNTLHSNHTEPQTLTDCTLSIRLLIAVVSCAPHSDLDMKWNQNISVLSFWSRNVLKLQKLLD